MAGATCTATAVALHKLPKAYLVSDFRPSEGKSSIGLFLITSSEVDSVLDHPNSNSVKITPRPHR
jgi:hypothetical protein